MKQKLYIFCVKLPASLSAQRFYFREVRQSRLPVWEKAVCLAYLPIYSNNKAVKWRRLLMRAVFGVKEAG